MSGRASKPIRSRTQEAQPSAQAHAQQPRRRFTSAVPDSGSRGITTDAAVAVPAYSLVMNHVWQPQRVPPTNLPDAQPMPPQPYILQQQYQQPAEPSVWVADIAQQGSKRPRLTAEPEEPRSTGAEQAAAAPRVVAAGQPEQHQQHLQQEPYLQQVLPAAAQSRFEQLSQLAAASPEGGSCHQDSAANVQLPIEAASLPPAQAEDVLRVAAEWQPEASHALPAARAPAPAPVSRRSTLPQEVQQPSAASDR